MERCKEDGRVSGERVKEEEVKLERFSREPEFDWGGGLDCLKEELYEAFGQFDQIKSPYDLSYSVHLTCLYEATSNCELKGRRNEPTNFDVVAGIRAFFFLGQTGADQRPIQWIVVLQRNSARF